LGPTRPEDLELLLHLPAVVNSVKTTLVVRFTATITVQKDFLLVILLQNHLQTGQCHLIMHLLAMWHLREELLRKDFAFKGQLRLFQMFLLRLQREYSMLVVLQITLL
jgi:hypothetical protein